MLNEQLGPLQLSQRRRIAISRDRELGEIDRAEDAFKLDWRHGLSISRHGQANELMGVVHLASDAVTNVLVSSRGCNV